MGPSVSTRRLRWMRATWWSLLAASGFMLAATFERLGQDELTSVAADLVVVGVFMAVGLRDRTAGGLLASAVAPLWLATTLWASVTPVHLGVLFAAVMVQASVVVDSPVAQVLVSVVAGLLATGLLDAPASSVAFAVGGGVILASRRRASGAAYLVAAAWIPALVTAFLWGDDSRDAGLTPQVRLSVYQLTLLACGVLLLASVTARRRYQSGLTNLLLAGPGDGVAGLERELAITLRDSGLRILRVDDPALGIVILEGDGPPVTVASRSALLRDPLTVAAVARAVRLTLRNAELHAQEARHLSELETARGQLQRTVDEARRGMRQALQVEVATPLVALVPDIDLLSDSSARQEAAEAMRIAKAEIATAVEDIDALVLGLPPSDLGQGQLMTAIARVVASSPVPVRIVAEPGVGFSTPVETTLYYVCCEAIANAVKHSGASSISCRVAAGDSRAEVTVSDDGRGGADLLGSGLQGLQDRVESMHGHLSVSSPPDGGTTVTALVPLS